MSSATATPDAPVSVPVVRVQTETAMTTAVGNGFFENATQRDIVLPRVQIHQATSYDMERIGDLPIKPGEFYEVNSLEKMPTNRIVPIIGYNEWIKFGPQIGDPIEYRTRNLAEVPPGDLDWKDHGDGKGVRPAATQFMCFVCVFDGSTEPVILSFKRKSLKAGKTILNLELSRLRKNGPRAVYVLETQKKTDKGVYFVPVVRPGGPAESSLSELVDVLRDSLAGAVVRGEDEQNDHAREV